MCIFINNIICIRILVTSRLFMSKMHSLVYWSSMIYKYLSTQSNVKTYSHSADAGYGV